jgi:RHS repeat-associated protein
MRIKRLLLLPLLLALLLFANGAGNWAALIPPVYAARGHTLKGSPTTPNTFNPTGGASPRVHSYHPGPMGKQPPHAPQVIAHPTQMSMKPGTVALSATKATKFVGSDGRLELLIPAGAVTAQDIAAAGGTIILHIIQVAPASGSNAGSHISLGTYLLQLTDARGTLLTHGLRQPLTALYHVKKHEFALGLDHAYVVMGSQVADTMLKASGVVQPSARQSLASLAGPPRIQKSDLDPKAQTLTTTVLLSTPSASMNWGSDSPIASFGKPDPFSTDLSSGGLTSDLPIDVPVGPGGLTPPVSLSYSSEAVNSQHSYSAAAGWVGEGWNLSLGSINWSEQNVTMGCSTCGATWENSWQLSDPYGTASEIIPPNINVSTSYDDTPNYYCATGNANAYPCPILWHTATESHAKIYAYVGTLSVGSSPTPPCFRVWLPNGIMEEFGCTADSLQYFYEAGIGALISGWYLDLITDPQGNQIHLTYQRDMENWTSPKTGNTYSYPRDVVLSSIQYDSPTCHNAQTMCTGSAWAPLMQVVFNASHTPTTLTGTAPSGCNTGANLRCDDPFDLSGSGGVAAPLIQSTYVLNSIQVQVRSSGTASWNTLRTYKLGYEQSAPTSAVDPVSGKNASVAGMLDLTQVQEVGTDGTTALPTRTFTYTTLTNYYEDAFDHPTPSTNCGPSWNTGNGSGCPLWSQSYPNNSRFLATASNGLGLLQTFSWVLARNNSHGVPGGGSNNADPLYCDSHQSGYPCNEADDSGWSHVVLSQESNTTLRLTQNGQGGQQTSTPVTETTGYTYQLTYPLPAQECSDCVAGMYWGNQNSGDYLNYFDGKFMGFAQVTVSLPDGAVEVHKFYAGEGWGVYDTSQVTCYSTSPCHNDPWWDLANAAHGHEYQTLLYDTNGTTLLKQTTTTYQTICPPNGVAGTPASPNYGNWDGKLVSALNHNNPVAVCDIQQTQQVEQTFDGSSNSTTQTTSWMYDSYGRQTQETITTNGGTPGKIVHNTSYVWNDAVTATQNSASGTYLIDMPAFTDTEDGAGNRTACSSISYDNQSYTTGQTSTLTIGLETSSTSYTYCGTSANGYTPSGPITTTTAYDTYGNKVGTNDADANAGIGGHLGCSVSSVQHTDCSTYDSTYEAMLVSSTNALGQTSNTSYTQTASGGFGLWPMSATDFNGKTTTYTYDALGRMTGQTLPGETGGGPTKSWSFASWCTAGTAQAPCLEVDETDRLNNNTTITDRAFYDGYGRLVETRDPGPNGQDVVVYAYYDAAGHMVFESSSYFVPAYTGPAGAAAYSLPDSTQPGTTTTYDGLERVTSVTNPGSQTTSTSYSVVCGVAAYNDSGCYEQTTVVDANSHEHSTLATVFGHVAYDQRYTGNSSSTYTLYATTAYLYDTNGNLITIKQPASNATNTFTFDAAGRKIAQTDPDRGTENYTYDPNGNLVQSVDARGSAGTVYAGYDGLNRLLWRNTTNNPTNARVSYTYDSTANGNVGIGRLTGEQFTGSGGLTGSYTYTYDQRGQQVGLTVTVNGHSYTEQKTFDDDGHLISETYPTGEVVQVAYTAQGWLSQVTTTANSVTTTLASNISFAGLAGASGQITGMNLGNGVYSYSASYDVVQRLTSASITRVSDGRVLFQTQPTYDAVGNVTSTQTTLPDGTDTQGFCYNEQNQLTWAGTSATTPCGSQTPGTLTAAQYQQSYAYDLNGRLTTGPLGTYTYGDPNHLHAATSTSSGYSAAYDAAGNMICRAPTSQTTCSGSATGQLLSYDAEGNLASWQDQPTPLTTVNYLYDGEGNRVAMQVTGSSTPSTTIYIDTIEEVQLSSATITTTYYYAGSDRIAEAVNGVFSYLGTDRLGSPLIALSATGTETASQLYAPYGATRYTNGVMPGNRGFTGQVADGVTGLDYYVSRYYDPSLGQFISADTALPSNGYDPWGLSRYAYVQGNPETMTDPDGHCWPLCSIVIGAIVGAVVGAAVSVATQAASGHGVNWGQVGRDAASGAVSGAISGLAGPEAGFLAHAAIGAASGAAGQMVNNIIDHKPLGDGVLTAAIVGGVTGVAAKGAGQLLKRFGGKFFGSVSKEADAEGATCGLSFSADTPVATPQGEQPISSLRVGDQVKAYNPATKQVSVQTVQQVFINHDTDLINVTLAVQHPAANIGQTKLQQVAVASHGSQAPPVTVEVVHTTQNHPWLTTKGWVVAGSLHIGDQVQQLDGTTATVVALQVLTGIQDMYDLTVSNVHTFAVGNGQFVVHNCNNETLAKSATAISKNLHEQIPAGRGFDRTTVGVGFAQDSKGNLFTLVSTNSYKRVNIIRPLARRAGYIFTSGPDHAEKNIMNKAAEWGWNVLAIGTSRPACPDCANMMRAAGFSGSTGIGLGGRIATSSGGLRNIISWWR